MITTPTLLCFAHGLEAKAFLQNLDFQPLGTEFYHSTSKDLYLSVTGEGPLKALSQTLQHLTQHPRIRKVVNMGLCGGLSESSQSIGDILDVRTIYSDRPDDEQGVQFHSFSTNAESRVDLVTAWRRITSIEKAQELARFAQLVDREAWGHAYACKQLNRDFQCKKIISDFATNLEQCFEVRAKALEYSQALFEHYFSVIEPDFPTQPPEFDFDIKGFVEDMRACKPPYKVTDFSQSFHH